MVIGALSVFASGGPRLREVTSVGLKRLVGAKASYFGATHRRRPAAAVMPSLLSTQRRCSHRA